MAKKEIAVKKYVVKLSSEERKRLEALIHAGKSSTQTLTRARILLKADISEAGEGWSDSAISAALDTSVNNVARTRQLLVEEGFEATLSRKSNPNSARQRIFDGAAEAKLIALACSPAPQGFARWTLRLLEEKVVELNISWRRPATIRSDGRLTSSRELSVEAVEGLSIGSLICMSGLLACDRSTERRLRPVHEGGRRRVAD